MNEENFQKFTNRSKKNTFRNANGKRRNKREQRSDRHKGKQIINDLIFEDPFKYNEHNDDNNQN